MVTPLVNAQQVSFLRAQLDERDRHLETLLQRDAELREENKRQNKELARVRGSLDALREELSQSRHRLAAAEAMLKEILGSKAWRLVTILRRIKAALPPWR